MLLIPSEASSISNDAYPEFNHWPIASSPLAVYFNLLLVASANIPDTLHIPGPVRKGFIYSTFPFDGSMSVALVVAGATGQNPSSIATEVVLYYGAPVFPLWWLPLHEPTLSVLFPVLMVNICWEL
jgi:hypothetical protein